MSYLIYTLISIFLIILCILIFKRKKRKVNTVFDFKKDVDYKIVKYANTLEDGTKTLAEIELLTGKYSGVVYSYGDVSSISEEDSDDFAKINFEYFLVENNTGIDLEHEDEFLNHIGEVLVSMVLSANEEKLAFDSMLENMKILDTETDTSVDQE